MDRETIVKMYNALAHFTIDLGKALEEDKVKQGMYEKPTMERKMSDARPTKQKLEIERKYLLSRIPYAVPDEVIVIRQLYKYDPDGTPTRMRRAVGMNGVKYTKTVKTQLGVGTFREDESVITSRDFMLEEDDYTHEINKIRYVYNIPGTELKWEVDSYYGLDEFDEDFEDLVTAEIELPSIDHEFQIEEWIGKYILDDITGDPEYLNSNMAIEIDVPDSKSLCACENCNCKEP